MCWVNESERNSKPPAMQVEDESFSFKHQKPPWCIIVIITCTIKTRRIHWIRIVYHIPNIDVNIIFYFRQNIRQVIYRQFKVDIGSILRELRTRKGINIIEAELCPDHVHMLLEIPPKCSVSEIMGYLKGKSSLIILDRHANLKYKYGNRHFWCRWYCIDTVGAMRRKSKNIYRIN